MWIVVACMITLGVAQNMLQNPGFESWSGGMPDYWFKDDSIAIFQEDVIIHGGNFSAKDSLFTQTQEEADFWQGTYGIQPSTYYTCSFWILDNDPAGRVRAGFWWFPSGSSWPNQYSVDSASWQEWYVDTLLSPANSESVTVFLRAYDVSANWDGDAIFYIDDVFFGPTTTPQPPVINRVWHKPINPAAGVSENIYAKATDSDGTIDADTLYYGVNNLATPIKLSHTSVSNDTFSYQIPGQADGDTVFYFLQFVDNDALETFSDTHAYYVGELDIYINEILYDTDGSDAGCFIELYGLGDMSLSGFLLIGVNGYNGQEYQPIDLSGYTIPADGFLVIAQDATVPNYDLISDSADYQNGGSPGSPSGDNVELRFNNIVIDALGYGDLGSFVFAGEWIPAPDVGPDTSLGRYPDGNDTDNNYSDFLLYAAPTPGLPNPDIGISETNSIVTTVPMIINPVVSGVQFTSIIEGTVFYPITVYNVLGRVVVTITKPTTTLDIPTGIYFLRLNSIEKGSAKLIVVR